MGWCGKASGYRGAPSDETSGPEHEQVGSDGACDAHAGADAFDIYDTRADCSAQTVSTIPPFATSAVLCGSPGYVLMAASVQMANELSRSFGCLHDAVERAREQDE